MKQPPSVILDPTLFRRHSITLTPTIVLETSASVRKASGILSFEWLENADDIENRAYGPTFGIVEKDLIEEIKDRVYSTDWERVKREAMENFWVHQKKPRALPKASKYAVRVVDLSITVTRDVYDAKGQRVAFKGQKIRPQDYVPMSQGYIVFNGKDKEQIKLALKIGDRLRKKNKPVVFIFSEINTNNGWKSFNELSEFLHARIYQLNNQMIDRFDLKHLPCLIESDGADIVVREYSKEEDLFL